MIRNSNIDFVRCLANYIIILLHAGAAFQYCLQNSLEYKFWIAICWGWSTVALPALFFISGYLLFQNYSLASYTRKIKNRFSRLAIPYVTWNCTFVGFYLILAQFVPRLGNRVNSFGLDTFQGALSKIISLTIAPIDGPLWFIRTLLLFSIVSPLLWLLLRSLIGRIVGFIAITFAYILCWKYNTLEEMHLTYPMYAIVLYYLGGLLTVTNNAENRFNWFKSPLWLIPSIIGFVLILYITFIDNIRLTPSEAFASDLGKVLMTPFLFYLTNHLNVNKLSTNRIYLYLKDMSFFAYAGHFLFCSMIMHTVAPFLSFMTTGKFTVLVFIFCGIGVPVMAGIYWIGKKYLPHIMKLYDGTL